jgi:hypothetical protein
LVLAQASLYARLVGSAFCQMTPFRVEITGVSGLF